MGAVDALLEDPPWLDEDFGYQLVERDVEWGIASPVPLIRGRSSAFGVVGHGNQVQEQRRRYSGRGRSVEEGWTTSCLPRAALWGV